MRYLVGFAFVLALVASPRSVSAQDAEEATTAEPSAEEAAPPSEPASEEPALQLKLDDAGVEVGPSPPPTPTTEYGKARLRPLRIGFAVSVIAFGGGVAMMGVGFSNYEGELICIFEPCPRTPPWAIGVSVGGVFLAVGGLTGMIIAGKRLAERKAELRWYASAPESRHGTPPRVRWDLARSRLVF